MCGLRYFWQADLSLALTSGVRLRWSKQDRDGPGLFMGGLWWIYSLGAELSPSVAEGESVSSKKVGPDPFYNRCMVE